MRKYILLTVLLLSLGISWVVFAQTKAKSRTETVTAYDKKAKKFITHKESYQTYNSNGDVTEEFGYDKKGVVNKHIKYEYNSFGKKTKEIHYKDNTSSIKFLVEFVYDSRGLKIEELEKTADGSKTTSKRVFTYGF
ncbi:MAG: hypothetical protein RL138_1428 [Bacteroidota bacterium]|jgi:hypothetical protein